MNEIKPTEDYGLVSIIMPNYNCAKYLPETIKSVLDQTYQNWELLFVDDCSSDNSVEIVESYNDPRIRIFRNEKNSGAAVSRNVALREANGRWIAFLDSDDLWTSEKLEKQISFMRSNDVGFSYTYYFVVDEDNNPKSNFIPKLTVCTYEDVLKHNYIGCLTAIYDSDKLGKHFMPTNATKREDFACWLSILKTGVKAYCLHESLAKYRVHSNSVSSNKIKIIKWQWNVYRNVEKLPLIKSFYYMFHWAVNGFFKY